jgi:hypothetical protein
LPEDAARSVIRSAFLRRELMALRIELLAKEVLEFDQGALDWSERARLAITDDAAEKVKRAGLPLTVAFCHPDLLTARPYLVLWYRGLAMMSRKEAPGDLRGPEEKGSRISHHRADQLVQVLNRHISAVLAIGQVTLAALKGIAYSTVGATLQGKWGNEIGKIQTVFEEFVLDQLAALGQLEEVRTHGGWPTWSREALREEQVLSARLTNGCYGEFSDNPDVAFYDRESPDERTIICAMEVKGGTDESNAYYRSGRRGRDTAAVSSCEP